MQVIPLQGISQLDTGDIIRHKMSKNTYVITANYGKYAIGVQSVHVSNPHEWELIIRDEKIASETELKRKRFNIVRAISKSLFSVDSKAFFVRVSPDAKLIFVSSAQINVQMKPHPELGDLFLAYHEESNTVFFDDSKFW